jgi:hypothetical protein
LEPRRGHAQALCARRAAAWPAWSSSTPTKIPIRPRRGRWPPSRRRRARRALPRPRAVELRRTIAAHA